MKVEQPKQSFLTRALAKVKSLFRWVRLPKGKPKGR